MYKTIKTITFIISTVIIMVTTSCLSGYKDEILERTPEIEKEERDEVLDKIIETGYDIDTTELGIYYVTFEEGEGAFPQTGDTLFLEYTGYLLGGIIFDTSTDRYTDGIWEFVYKENELIAGFDDGLALLNKGAEMDWIIPSNLAYAENGAGIIPPYSTLIFSAKMHNIKPKQN